MILLYLSLVSITLLLICCVCILCIMQRQGYFLCCLGDEEGLIPIWIKGVDQSTPLVICLFFSVEMHSTLFLQVFSRFLFYSYKKTQSFTYATANTIHTNTSLFVTEFIQASQYLLHARTHPHMHIHTLSETCTGTQLNILSHLHFIKCVCSPVTPWLCFPSFPFFFSLY